MNTLSIQRPRPSIETHPSLDQYAGECRAGELAALDAVLFVKPRFLRAQK
jgi:hypothetical protein